MLLRLLGPFDLRTPAGSRVRVGGARVRMLIARLALDPGRAVPADALIEDLWASERPSGAINALQSLVSRARRVLREVDGMSLRSAPAGYVLDVAPDEIDLHRFEHLAEQGRGLLASDQAGDAAKTLRAAVDLWRGDALVDLIEAPFATFQAARLDRLRLSARLDRIEADLRLGRHAELLAELETLTARHPQHERAAALRMRALHSCGRQAEALDVYETIRAGLAERLGADPGRELRELHLAVLRGDPEAAPGSRPEHPEPASRTRPLPVRLSSFVGREVEIEQVRTCLAESRLVTLFGPGGAGKTRLSIESVAGDEDRRVLFVELAPVRDSQDLVSSVSTALGVRESILQVQPAATNAPAPLIEELSARPTLLVLDNCEHVITAAAALVEELVACCPELHVLTTSREPLALAGEKLLQVGPLELPHTGSDAAAGAAVRLFTDRATAVRQDFVLDEHNTPHVVEICRRLDGMPLAIELAAARLRAMSVRGVAERLDDRFRLLTRGNRTSVPRHRTLRAVVEWSWELLAEPERVLAGRMSVFAGAAGEQAVVRVCAGGTLAHTDIAEVLTSLVEKSLVEAVETEHGMRYRMLETVRAYCAERLADTGEHSRVATMHAAYFLDFAETAGERIHLAEQLHWLGLLDAEHDNILGALHHCITAGDAERALRFAAALSWYWSMAARTEITTRLDEVAALPGDSVPRSRAVVGLQRALLSNTDDWMRQLSRAVTEVRDTGAMESYLYIAMLEPVVWMITGQLEEMDRSIDRAYAHPQPWANAAGLFAGTVGAEHRGDIVGAETCAQEAVEAFRKVGDRWGVAQGISTLAGHRSLRGDHAGAVEALRESAGIVRELRSVEDLVPQLARIGMERARAGDLDGARRELHEAENLATGAFVYHRITVLCGLAEVARAAGDRRQAWRHLDRCEFELGRAQPVPQPLRRVLLAFQARLLLDEADTDPRRLDAARQRLAQALEVGSQAVDMPLTAMLAEQAAGLLFTLGEAQRAAGLLGVAVALRGVLDEGDPEVRALLAALEAAPGQQERMREFRRGSALSREDAHAELAAVLCE